MSSSAWWWRAATGGQAGQYLVLAGVTLGLLAVACRAWVRSHPFPRRSAARDGQAGTATIEFTLVFPIVLFLILLLVQTTLVMVGNIVVHYAAYAATRSAIVQIPRSILRTGETRNTILISPTSVKLTAIRRAAIFAVLPVCGNGATSGDSATSNQLVAALRSYYASAAQGQPRWVDRLIGSRLRYADLHTRVTLFRTQANDGGVRFLSLAAGRRHTFGPRDPITVQVTHDLNLSVPYVRAIFADGRFAEGDHGAYTRIKAQYTLTNEGVDPDLPSLPPLPRVP